MSFQQHNDIRGGNMEKCLYYNNYSAPATLMIDDLSFVSIVNEGMIRPQTDWGGGLSKPGSLYKYILDTLLTWFPEIRGTFFFPTEDHAFMHPGTNYRIYYDRDILAQKEFFTLCCKHFEIAFHGTTHGRYRSMDKCEPYNNWEQEFSYLTLDDIPRIRSSIDAFEERYGVHMTGGKYPGYRKNEFSVDIVRDLGFHWWAADSGMINRKCRENHHTYCNDKSLLLLPTNLSGGSFSQNKLLYSTSGWKTMIKKKFPAFFAMKKLYRDSQIEEYINYLYENRMIISIQEHFMNLCTNGRRQTPNIYDDVYSVARIYDLLRGIDVWHTSCGTLAHYIESYDHSTLAHRKDGLWEISYNGSWDTMFLTVSSDRPYLRNHATGEAIHGVYRMGKWIYNKIEAGVYEEL